MVEKLKYKKLRAGTGSSLVSRHSLWIGGDHLLSVTNTYGTENYHRYYFGEIQALVAHRTSSWVIGNIVLGVVTACFLIPALLLLREGNSGVSISLFVFAGILGVIFLLYLLAGPTGKIFVQTATSYDQIPGVTRWFSIRKIMRRLDPLIRQAQQMSVPAAESAPGGQSVPDQPAAQPSETAPTA